MTRVAISRPIRAEQAVIEFETVGKALASPPSFISQDVLILQAIAGLLARVARDIAALFPTLDTARRVTGVKGAATRADPFTIAAVDEYAVVEALFWDRLSNEAETLLKVLLRQALSEVQP
jgi:hypothetical protein